jgi:hypothetical protein
MADTVSLSDHAGNLHIEQIGVPGITATSTNPTARPRATSDYATENQPSATVRPGPGIPHASERSDVELSPQISKSSKSIRLESPPVVIRPPKVKSDSFSYAALSWLSWKRNEEKDIPDCARSMRRSYSYRTTFRFLGFSLSQDISYKTSAGGIDAAIASVRLVRNPW